jgi:hypothetical protein
VWSGTRSIDAEAVAAKILIGTELTDAECQEALAFYQWLAPDANRHAWKLKHIGANLDGLYAIGGAGPHMTNDGALDGGGAPVALVDLDLGLDGAAPSPQHRRAG